MEVRQVPVEQHPLLMQIWHSLIAQPVMHVWNNREQDRAALSADIANGPQKTDRCTASLNVCAVCASLTESYSSDSCYPGVLPRGMYYYPSGGGMGWHTNSDKPGWRAYVVRVPENARSYFKTIEGIIPDKNGHANLFKTGPDSWHCVDALTERWSFGIWLPDRFAAEIIGG